MGKHFYTTNPDEVTKAIRHDGKILEGVACYVLPHTQDHQFPIVPLYRFYNPSIDDHLYTISSLERQELLSAGFYIDENVACDVYYTDSRPDGTYVLFRLLNQDSGEHFYTTDVNEYQELQRQGFFTIDSPPNAGAVYDVNQGAVPQGAIPFYRLFTP